MSHYDLIPSLESRPDELLQRRQEAAARIDWSYYDYLPLDEYRMKTVQSRPARWAE